MSKEYKERLRELQEEKLKKIEDYKEKGLNPYHTNSDEKIIAKEEEEFDLSDIDIVRERKIGIIVYGSILGFIFLLTFNLILLSEGISNLSNHLFIASLSLNIILGLLPLNFLPIKVKKIKENMRIGSTNNLASAGLIWTGILLILVLMTLFGLFFPIFGLIIFIAILLIIVTIFGLGMVLGYWTNLRTKEIMQLNKGFIILFVVTGFIFLGGVPSTVNEGEFALSNTNDRSILHGDSSYYKIDIEITLISGGPIRIGDVYRSGVLIEDQGTFKFTFYDVILTVSLENEGVTALGTYKLIDHTPFPIPTFFFNGVFKLIYSYFLIFVLPPYLVANVHVSYKVQSKRYPIANYF